MNDDKAIEVIESIENTSELTEHEREVEKSLVRKIDIRFIPVTILIYLLCYLDRSNIGNAKILNSDSGDDILQTLSLSNHAYVVALMVFLVAYSVFEVPSNLALKIISPAKWISFLVIAFGSFCTGIGGVQDATSLTVLRFFLGAAEAGVFPGLMYYFTFWYKPSERAFRIACFLCSATLAGAFGGCIAYGVGHMNGALGLQAWRWLFIVEGAPTVFLGICLIFFLPSYPEDVSWLTAEEQSVQQLRLGRQRNQSQQKINWKDAKATLLDLRMYGHYLAYTGIGCGVASLSLFAPTIIQGLGYRGLHAQLFTVPPYAVAYVCTMLAAYASDRYQMRGLIAGTSLACSTLCFIVLAVLPGERFTGRYVLLIFATSGVFAALPSLNAWVGDNATNTTAMSLVFACNVAFSGPGQIAGVWIYRSQDAPLYRLGHGVNACFTALACSLSFVLYFYYRGLNKKVVRQGYGHRWME
ncbi:putative transporter [Cercospora beticola]|uniref:Putative transporter n=1 Tax=Cercospora beticola TaxID=122368 RepID=A0A2G5I1L9_CERBT|nr:putative transporter [Cercospora beticola]PIA98684.1 putative transporter [Cercospora beticola]WPB00684.1 hypothetical protein RHO25_005304 [Cercospora beticola]CAK1361079.1 unnamed protein product [Cercospora beticola]